MNGSYNIKYLAVNSRDRKWGLVVTSVGYQSSESNVPKPHGIHPSKYNFKKDTGRILDEFQLLYLARGKGRLYTETLGRDNPVTVREGDMFLLFPGEWHTYYPDEGCYWDEFWIGFQGNMANQWVEEGFLNKAHPLFSVGVRESIPELYRRAIDLATSQKPGFAQAMSGIAIDLVGRAAYYDLNKDVNKNAILDIVNKAKILAADELRTISPEQLAEKLSVGYSFFRKVFKQFTGFAPGQYITELKVERAKELLLGTNYHIKEIAWELGFVNQDYFVTVFRRHTGERPTDYRARTSVKTITE